MAYDPMRYASRPGDTVANIGGMFGQLVAQLPEIQRAQQDMEFNNVQRGELYKGAVELLDSSGLDGLNVPQPGPNEDLAEYSARLGEFLSPYVQQGQINADMVQSLSGVSSQEPVQTAMQSQRTYDQYQSQLPSRQASQSQVSGDPMMVTMPDGGSFTEQAITERQIPRERILREEDSFEPLMKITMQGLRSGQVSPEAASDRLARIEEKKLELAREKEKTERERLHRKQDMGAELGASALGQNREAYDKEGNLVTRWDPMDVIEGNLSFGGMQTKAGTASNRGGGGGGSDPNAKSNLATEYNRAITRLQSTQTPYMDDEIAQQLKRNVQTLGLASSIQSRSGGPEVMPDERAKTESENLILLRDSLRNLQSAVTDPAVQESARGDSAYIDSFLKRLPADVYQQVTGWLQGGASVNQILLEVERTIDSYGLKQTNFAEQ